jgi:hypothetical protein
MSDTRSHESDVTPGESWCVTRCRCGHVTLQLGEFQRTFTQEQFEQLHRLLQSALRQFRVDDAARASGRPRALTH